MAHYHNKNFEGIASDTLDIFESGNYKESLEKCIDGECITWSVQKAIIYR